MYIIAPFYFNELWITNRARNLDLRNADDLLVPEDYFRKTFALKHFYTVPFTEL
jgi:hypothetical protein